MIFHKYCGIFGLPNEGVHQMRFLGMGLVDLVATMILTIFLKMTVNSLKDENIIVLFLVTFVVGQIFHFFFGVNTAFMNFVGFHFPPCPKP